MSTAKTPAKTAHKAENTHAPEKRDDTTDQTVTELAEIDAHDDDKDLREKAGITGKVEDASEAQQHVYHGLKDAKAHAKDPTKPINPHVADKPHHLQAGPGSDIG